MAKIMINGTDFSTPLVKNEAERISYDNSTSGLSATNVQGAIDGLATELKNEWGITQNIDELKNGTFWVNGYDVQIGTPAFTNDHYLLTSVIYQTSGLNIAIQTAISLTNPQTKVRFYQGNAWSDWNTQNDNIGSVGIYEFAKDGRESQNIHENFNIPWRLISGDSSIFSTEGTDIKILKSGTYLFIHKLHGFSSVTRINTYFNGKLENMTFTSFFEQFLVQTSQAYSLNAGQTFTVHVQGSSTDTVIYGRGDSDNNTITVVKIA